MAGEEELPSPPATLADVMATQTQLLLTLAQGLGQRGGPNSQSRMLEFTRLRPPTFDNTEDELLAADDWLRDINKKLDNVATSDHERVMLAAHQLFGAAGEWWDNYREAATDPTDITWKEFQQAFLAYHIPVGTMKMKTDEFRALKQGAMTVNQYIKKFMKLARYALGEVDTDQKKQDRFLDGLSHIMQAQLVTHTFPDFNTMMNKAILLEKARAGLDGEIKRKFQAKKSRQIEKRQQPRFGKF